MRKVDFKAAAKRCGGIREGTESDRGCVGSKRRGVGAQQTRLTPWLLFSRRSPITSSSPSRLGPSRPNYLDVAFTSSLDILILPFHHTPRAPRVKRDTTPELVLPQLPTLLSVGGSSTGQPGVSLFRADSLACD